jgi:hypothetical protein
MSAMPSWVSEAAEAVTAATDSAQLQTQVDTLTEAQRDLSVHLTRLSALKSATTAGGGTWFTTHTAPPEVFEALKGAARTPVQGTLGTLNRTLSPFVAAAEAKALADWRAYSEARLGAVSDLLQLAGTLSGVASVAPLATALAEVLRKLVPATNRLPTPDVFDLLGEAEARRKALEDALQPDSVRQFLSAVARGGASLSMLTDDVRAWLSANRAEGSVRIMAGSPVEA